MPTIATSTIIQGPATATFDGATHYSASDINSDITTETFKVESAAFGTVDERIKSRIAAVKFQPLELTSANAAKLFPYASTLPGTELCGGSDRPLVIQTLAGKKHTFNRACIASMPNLTFAVDKLLLGDMMLNATCATASDLATADSLVKVEAAAYSAGDFAPARILGGPWSVSWGSSFAAIPTEGGVAVNFSVQTEPVYIDGLGIIGWAFKGISATVTFIPVGLSEADWNSMQQVQGVGFGIGASGATRGNDLVITGSGLTFTLTACAPTQGQTRWGGAKLPGQITMQAHRKFTAGAMQPLFTFAFGS